MRQCSLFACVLCWLWLSSPAISQDLMLADYDQALKTSQLEQRPMLVILGAEWCSWCRKLEGELSETPARDILNKWVVIKIDVDRSPELAEKFEAGALPGLRILRTDQTIAAGREGYLPTDQLRTWLDEFLPVVDPVIQRVLYDSESPDGEAVGKLIAFLGDRGPQIRAAAEDRLIAAADVTRGAVVDVLRTGGLSQKLSALTVLKSWGAPVESFDPWAPDTINSDSLEPLLEWSRQRSDITNDDPAEKDETPMEPAEISEAIGSLLNAEPALRMTRLNALVRIGEPLIGDIRLRLATAETLSDQQRETLRELLYRIQVGPQTGLERTAQLTALASLDAESHRRAAIEILQAATSQDEPLVDELSVDADPLIRETAVVQTERIGSMSDPDRLKRLLDDPSPSVRTAVLRNLAENPRDPLVDALVDYLKTETEEDLLVYATKTLGQLESNPAAEQALLELSNNESWRIRAAVMDALQARFESQGLGYYSGFGDESSGTTNLEMAKVVLAGSSDVDLFVAEKAIKLIPEIISDESADLVLEFLVKNPGRFKEMTKDLSEYEREQKFTPLVSRVEQRLKSEQPDEVRFATELLLELDPNRLRDALPTLLASSDTATRIAAARAVVASIGLFRDEQKLKLQNRGKVQFQRYRLNSSEDPNRFAWLEIPDSFLTLAERAEPVPVEDSFGDELGADGMAEQEDSGGGLFGGLLGLFGGSRPRQLAVEERTEPMEVIDADMEDDLDAVDDLFGDPFEARPTIKKQPLTSEKSESKDPTLLSEWLAKWQDLKTSRPRWVAESMDVMEARLTLASESENEVEVSWFRLALLASGKTEVVGSLLQTVERSVADAPTLSDVWPWLPEDVRDNSMAMLTTRFTWTDFDKQTQERLYEITEIDDRKVSQWLLDGVRQKPALSHTDLALMIQVLLRSFNGSMAEEVQPYIMGTELQQGMQAFAEFTGSRNLVDHAATIDWMLEKYRSAENANERALLLGVMSYYDHALATRLAVSLVCGDFEHDLLLQTALAISLCDRTWPSVDRATLWLTHESKVVRRAALERLLESGQNYPGRMADLGVAMVYDYSDTLPGLFHIAESVPSEVLEQPTDDEDERVRFGMAMVRLAASGEEAAELKDWSEQAEKNLVVVVALAKAKRTGDAALGIYRGAIETADQPAVLYKVLKVLNDEPGRELRAEMREKFGSEALRSF